MSESEEKSEVKGQSILREAFGQAFKFNVGDIVTLKVTLETLRAQGEIAENKTSRYERRSSAPGWCLVVNLRSANQCSGGVQMMYECGSLSSGGDRIQTRFDRQFHQHELVSYKEAVDLMKSWQVDEKA